MAVSRHVGAGNWISVLRSSSKCLLLTAEPSVHSLGRQHLKSLLRSPRVPCLKSIGFFHCPSYVCLHDILFACMLLTQGGCLPHQPSTQASFCLTWRWAQPLLAYYVICVLISIIIIVCVCLCVWERERKTERHKDRETERCVYTVGVRAPRYIVHFIPTLWCDINCKNKISR